MPGAAAALGKTPTIGKEQQSGMAANFRSSQLREGFAGGAGKAANDNAEENQQGQAEGYGQSNENYDEEEENEEYISAMLASERMFRINKLQAEKKQVDEDLKNLGMDIMGAAGGGINRMKRWLPGIGNAVDRLFTGNSTKGKARLAALEMTVTSLKTVKALLVTARFIASLIDASIDTIKIGVSTIEIVIGILILILSPLIILIVGIFYWGAGIGKLTKTVKNVTKKVDDLLKKYEPELEKEKKKNSLLRRRTQIDRTISATARS